MKLNIKSYSIFFQRATTVSSHLQPTIFTINKQRENILLEIPIPVNFIYFFFINSTCIAIEISLWNSAALAVIGFGREDSLRDDIANSEIYQVDRDNLMKGQCDI